ncbi:hypothetical protein SPRG_12492 [Saprolegnia parasitica CBS 223.65]|uniref:ATP-binding Cassette (ABC) Superfamily n=1 Tax=Saprolegnia parasitica (strain CBS 223.65) TaxID=695850 RepID=A0A067BSM2_SAPPC|nr:hypothetical protein SPRG_12492 [Saprolegnia parasitica CBS 223.65]KDO21529.1 hypothetical protein SPRG_12492 [Saprolegnia parasitica CBS 223.65]|eukprot:XP_012207795.1 hypothetical protein SPRG_12492 [Saprolegnia parasitica CBS 223.65]
MTDDAAPTTTAYVRASDRVHPLEHANVFSTATLSWIDPLIRKGAARPLQEDDVWPLPANDTAAVVSTRFLHQWSIEIAKATPKLSHAIWRTFRREILFTLGLNVVAASFNLLQPWLIKSIVQFIQHDDDGTPVTTSMGVSSGYGLAALLASSSFLSILCGDYAQTKAAQIGCNVKSIFIDVVFLKTLQLSGTSKQSLTSGDVVTMTTVDSEKMLLGFWMGFWAIIAPAMLLAIMVLMGIELGAVVGAIAGVLMFAFLGAGYYSGSQVGAVKRRLLVVQAERVKLMSEILQGIRVVKLYAWETHLEAHITAVRLREFQLIRTYQVMRVVNTVTLYAAPLVTMAVSLLTYVALGHEMQSTTAFTVLALMNTASLPCMIFSNAVMHATDAFASCDRVNAFLLCDATAPLGLPPSSSSRVPSRVSSRVPSRVPSSPPVATTAASPPTATEIALVDATLAWHKTPTLHRISVSIATTTPSLTIVVGPVGSGKSSLVHALLGEMPLVDGRRRVATNVAFANQEAWIQHDTLRNNILFGDHLDAAKYGAVLDACQLRHDLASLPAGDATEIGERGINLSGGQKARVSLARALYKSDADVFLLDDPLSALDVHVASSVFRDGIQGLLEHKTVVLVLNSHYHLLPLADRVLVMADGCIVGDGPFDALQDAFPDLVATHATETKVMPTSSEHTTPIMDSKATTADETKTSRPALMTTEDRVNGAVSLQTYATYFGSSGWNSAVVVATIVLSYGACQGCVVAGDVYLGHWATTASLAKSLGAGGVYGGIMLGALTLVVGRSLFALYIAQKCSLHLHARLFRKVLSLPVPTFFDVTPLGRILNRFATDLDTLDSQIPFYGYLLLQFLFQILAVLVVCGLSTPYVLVLYPLMGYLFYKAQTYFNPASGALKRLELVTRSPLVTLVAEALDGLTTIRAFGLAATFVVWNRTRLDAHMRYFSTFYLSRCWFQMRLDMLSAGIVVAVAFLCIGLRSSIGVVAAGLSLTYAAQLSAFLSKAAMFYNNMDNMMTCVERLAHYDSLPGEDDVQKQDNIRTSRTIMEDDAAWPSEACITLTDVSMRYRHDLPLVLRDINLVIPGRTKVGVCGRTGSGKSSFVSALFRLVSVDAGVIAIDGVDIASISVTSLRSKLTIIPQDPVLFSGSLRFNLDPSGDADDAALWAALKHVQLASYVKSLGGLDFDVAERGANLSVGQRQLVCIARALLRQSKIVVLDEATANVDVASDRLIQDAIRTCFVNVTLLVIAHRLETILHCDRILVLEKGQVDEFDAPATLLQQRGTFHGLMQQAGLA